MGVKLVRYHRAVAPAADRFSSLANDLGLFFSVRIAEEQERITRAIAELYALVDEVIGNRRAHPRDDFVTGLVQVEAGGDRLSRDELRVMLVNPGSWIELLLMSADRDETAYPDPDRFDIAGAAPPVSTFGGGAHYCLDTALSRAELQEAIAVLAARYPRLEPAGAAVWRQVVGGNRCYGELPLRFGR